MVLLSEEGITELYKIIYMLIMDIYIYIYIYILAIWNENHASVNTMIMLMVQFCFLYFPRQISVHRSCRYFSRF